MNYKNGWLALAAVTLSLGFVACDGGGGGTISGGGTITGGGTAMTSAWYDVYGHYCSGGNPQAGCNFYANGYKIVDTADPYYHNYYNLQFATYQYTDSYGYGRSYTGYGWVSPDGVLYNDSGTALNDTGEASGRDVIGDLAAKEEQMVRTAGKGLAAKYALAEETGINIARSLNDWATLSRSHNRARTANDVKEFTKRTFGVKFEDAQKALAKAQSGDLSGLEALNGQIAASWSTTPETSALMMKNFFKKQYSVNAKK